MKPIVVLIIFSMCITSCKKDSIIEEQKQPGYLSNVKSLLKDSIDKTTYESLDFSKAIKTTINTDTSFVRIPFKEKLIQNEFLWVQTNQNGLINKRRMVSFDRDKNPAQRMTKYRPYYGYIVIKNLKGKKVLESEIENGYIIALHPTKKNQARNCPRTALH